MEKTKENTNSETTNMFSVDFEEWFSFGSNGCRFNINDWNRLESRIVDTSKLILDFLRSRNIKATFFVLGWVADNFPFLIQNIHSEGHEIANHGYSHKSLTTLNKREFFIEVERTNNAILKTINCNIIGFRAPVFSLVESTLWALDILKDMGFKYDSSVFPFARNENYGIKNFCTNISNYPNGVIEVPLSVAKICNYRVPASGGGYFRLYPYFVFKKMVKRINNSSPLVFYIHPWEIDENQPIVENLSILEKFRHYHGLSNTLTKLNKLCEDFSFTSITDFLRTNSYLK